MKAIVTGSFDPITIGHYELIKLAAEKFNEVYVVALVNAEKNHLFTLEQRKKIIELTVDDFDNVIADEYSGLTVDYMHKNNITKIIRGIRNEQEKEYENNLAAKMKEYDASFETVILPCDDRYSHVSSTLVRERLKEGKSIETLVHPNALDTILKMYRQKNI